MTKIMLLFLFFACQWNSYVYSIPVAVNIIYKEYDFPGQEPLATEYLQWMPPQPENKLYWVCFSAFVYEDSDRELEQQTIHEYILITEQDIPFGGDTPFHRAHLLYIQRTGSGLIQAIEVSQDKEKQGMIKKMDYPKFDSSTIRKEDCVEVYQYTETINPKMYFPFWCESIHDEDMNTLKESILGRTQGYHRLYFLPLRNADQLDLFIAFDFYRYVSVCFLEPHEVQCSLKKMNTYTRPVHSKFEDMPYWEDINQDAVNEILISTSINPRYDRSYEMPWITCYRWNGTDYVEDNELFYQSSQSESIRESLIRLQSEAQSNEFLSQEPRFIYDYYLGLLHYYREDYMTAIAYLENAERHSLNPCIKEKSEELLEKMLSFVTRH